MVYHYDTSDNNNYYNIYVAGCIFLHTVGIKITQQQATFGFDNYQDVSEGLSSQVFISLWVKVTV